MTEFGSAVRELRGFLEGAAAAACIVFTSSDVSADAATEARAAAEDAAAAHTDVAVAVCDAAASAGNGALAAKLKLSACPALAVRASKGGGLRVVPLAGAADLSAAVAKLSTGPPAPPQPAVSARKRSPYEPPSKNAKAGAKRAFPGKGTCIYWPRMPCLRCGCPWWSGEDWDARCVRCGWDCETEGYDDDSKPLRRGGWKERFDDFSAHIREGRVAPWPPK